MGAGAVLIEPLALVPAEDLGGMHVVDRRRLGGLGLVDALRLDEVMVLLVCELADRVAIGRLMRLAALNGAVTGIESGFKTILEPPDDVLEVVHFPIAKLLLPVLAKSGEKGRQPLYTRDPASPVQDLSSSLPPSSSGSASSW